MTRCQSINQIGRSISSGHRFSSRHRLVCWQQTGSVRIRWASDFLTNARCRIHESWRTLRQSKYKYQSAAWRFGIYKWTRWGFKTPHERIVLILPLSIGSIDSGSDYYW